MAMGLCVSKISIIISQQCQLWSNGTFTFVLPHYEQTDRQTDR